MAEYTSGIRFRDKAWDPHCPATQAPKGITSAEFLTGLCTKTVLDDLVKYLLQSISLSFGLIDPMLIIVDGDKYLIKRLVNGSMIQETLIDDRQRSLVKYVAKQNYPVNRFDFNKGRLLSSTRSVYDDLYPFCCIVPLSSLQRTSGFLLFNHPVSRRPLNVENTQFFKEIMIPAGLALDVALAIHQQGKLDPETGLLHKNFFSDQFALELRRTSMLGQPLTLAILEFRDLPALTCRFGEKAVQELIIDAGSQLKVLTRSNDLIFRFEEGRFVIIMGDTPKVNAHKVVGRLKMALERIRVDWRIRVAAGVAGFPYDGDTTRCLFLEAEGNLR